MSIAAPIEPPSGAAAAESTRVLYERHAARLYAFCLRRLGTPEDADDALQQTFLNAFASLRGGFVPTSEKAWLYRIAENVCTDRLRAVSRKRKHESATDALESAVAPSPTGELGAIAAALGTLGEHQRRALVLRAQGLSYREIGSELSLSQSAVETLLFRARRSLARRLDALSFAGWLKSALTAGGAAKATAAAVATIAVGAVAVTEATEPASRTPSPATASQPARANAGTPGDVVPVTGGRTAGPARSTRAPRRPTERRPLPEREQPRAESPATPAPQPERPRVEATSSPSAPPSTPPSAPTEAQPGSTAVTPPVDAPPVPPVQAPELPVPVPVDVPDPTTVLEPIVEAVPELPLPIEPELPTLP